MDADDNTSDVQEQPAEPVQPPDPGSYPVARETASVTNLNTIDIFGEKPFSV
jgi:hypothetical protein